MGKPTIYDVVRAESVALVDMQRRLFDAGLIATAHAVNAASQKLGWEAADKMAKLEKELRRQPGFVRLQRDKRKIRSRIGRTEFQPKGDGIYIHDSLLDY